MATCRFCGQDFGSRQAVRAHLKACAAYLGRFTRQAMLPQAAAAMPTQDGAVADGSVEEFDPVTQMRQQVSAEKLRLKLREVRHAHGELDALEEARRKAAADQATREMQSQTAAERERQAALVRTALDAEARRHAEQAKERLQGKRREAIQQAKQKAVEEWWGRFQLSSGVKAQILQAIESALAPLVVEELPQAELVQIAEGVRDRLHGQAVEAQNVAATRQQQKDSLERYGREYAERELNDVEGLGGLERWRIEMLIQNELRSLTGDESHAEVKDWVDEVLDTEGLGLADEDDAE